MGLVWEVDENVLETLDRRLNSSLRYILLYTYYSSSLKIYVWVEVKVEVEVDENVETLDRRLNSSLRGREAVGEETHTGEELIVQNRHHHHRG